MGIYINKGNEGFRRSEYVDKSGLIAVVNKTLFTEQCFSCVTRSHRVISLAYYYARNDYHIHREYPTGEGYADLVLIPRKNVDSPALVIELKYDKDTQAAISQIKDRNYPQKIAEYTGDILLVGINYDKDTKLHECQIEHYHI